VWASSKEALLPVFGTEPSAVRGSTPHRKLDWTLYPAAVGYMLSAYRESKKDIAIVVDQEYPVFGSEIFGRCIAATGCNNSGSGSV
jgi:hypothetical protein